MKKSDLIIQNTNKIIADLRELSRSALIYEEFFYKKLVSLSTLKNSSPKQIELYKEFEAEQNKFVKALFPFAPEVEVALCKVCSNYPCKEVGGINRDQLPCGGKKYRTRVRPLIKKKIESLEELAYWNKHPTMEKPIVMDWLLSYVQKLIKSKKIVTAKKARKLWIEFTLICECMTKEEATDRVDYNLHYWADRSGYLSEFEEHFGTYVPKKS